MRESGDEMREEDVLHFPCQRWFQPTFDLEGLQSQTFFCNNLKYRVDLRPVGGGDEDRKGIHVN